MSKRIDEFVKKERDRVSAEIKEAEDAKAKAEETTTFYTNLITKLKAEETEIKDKETRMKK